VGLAKNCTGDEVGENVVRSAVCNAVWNVVWNVVWSSVHLCRCNRGSKAHLVLVELLPHHRRHYLALDVARKRVEHSSLEEEEEEEVGGGGGGGGGVV
jgi:hypothetical protein